MIFVTRTGAVLEPDRCEQRREDLGERIGKCIAVPARPYRER
jgi:hypothetical protein